MPERMSAPPDAAELRRAFDADSALTVGLEEEVMLLEPDGLDLLPRAADVLARTRGDDALKGELPASQLELVTAPCMTVGEAATRLLATRARLAKAAEGIGVLGGVGVHPFAAPEGQLSGTERYESMLAEYGRIARLQLVFGLHVHVAIRPAQRALAVYNAIRSYLPELAALSANAPFLGGSDTGLASVRPKLSEILPRQGIPPAFADFDELAGAWAWGARAGVLSTPREWWWELRLHPSLGTVEVRVCDAQPTVSETAALAAVVQALSLWLVERHDSDDLPPPAPTWRIEENRWSACRHGTAGRMADLQTGEPEATGDRLIRLLETLRPRAEELGCGSELAAATTMLEQPAAERHRTLAAEHGLRGLVAWLAARFLLDE